VLKLASPNEKDTIIALVYLQNQMQLPFIRSEQQFELINELLFDLSKQEISQFDALQVD
jgi:hypothetical protein